MSAKRSAWYYGHMISALLFDLDNTLYSLSTGMESDILRRITDYVAAYLGISREEALLLRRERVRNFGTSLEWLMVEHGLTDYNDFLSAIHPEGEDSCLEHDPRLADFLDSIALPKAVMTNASAEHADRVLAKLGLKDKFTAVYDIRFSELRGKPRRDAYERVLSDLGYLAGEVFFVDDLRHQVKGFQDIGGYAALYDETDRHGDSKLPRIRSLYEIADILASPARLKEFRKPY